MKGIFVVIDGMGDLPCKSLGGKTPLEAAEMPNLDFFATRGEMGFMYPVRPGFVPSSDEALRAIFGHKVMGSFRGPLEAVGEELGLTRGDLAFSVNFGTIDSKGNVVDRRAGRNLTTKEAWALANSLNKISLPCKFLIHPTIQHRAVLVFYGGFSENISGNDWSYVDGRFRESFKIEKSKPLDEDENSMYTANIVNDFLKKAHEMLELHPVNLERKKKGLFPANHLFIRNPGIEPPFLFERHRWMAVTYRPLERGFAKLSKMKVFSFDYPSLKGVDAYEHMYSGLKKACGFAIKGLSKNYKNFDYAYIHLNEVDCAGHDNKPSDKKQMLELIDGIFFKFLKKFVPQRNINVVVVSNHSTPCRLKAHSADPVPVMVYTGAVPKIKKKKFNLEQKEIVKDLFEVIKQRTFKIKDDFLEGKVSEGKKFCEREARKGTLGRILGINLLKVVGFDK